MIRSSASSTIASRPEDVYHFVVTDFERNYRRWSPEVQRLEMLTKGPLRLGSRARQVRIDQGRRSDTRFQVIAMEPQRQVCFAELSRKFEGEYSITACDTGTRLQFEFRLKKVELIMRPFEKLIRTAIQDGADRTVRNIKRLVESESAAR